MDPNIPFGFAQGLSLSNGKHQRISNFENVTKSWSCCSGGL